jgi:Ca2+-binding RTX toxin-like protein
MGTFTLKNVEISVGVPTRLTDLFVFSSDGDFDWGRLQIINPGYSVSGAFSSGNIHFFSIHDVFYTAQNSLDEPINPAPFARDVFVVFSTLAGVNSFLIDLLILSQSDSEIIISRAQSLFTSFGDTIDLGNLYVAQRNAGAVVDANDSGAGNDNVRLPSSTSLSPFDPNRPFLAGTGNDTVVAGADAAAWIEGGADNDFLTGGGRADRLIGGNGDDVLRGLAGDDTLDGGEMIDRLTGGAGADELIGGAGDDRFFYSAAAELPGDKIRGDAGFDRIRIEGGGSYDFHTAQIESVERVDISTNAIVSIFLSNSAVASVSNRRLQVVGQIGSAPNIAPVTTSVEVDASGFLAEQSLDFRGATGTINGGREGFEGNDIITGGRGNDSIAGGAGNDVIQGGDGRDLLIGGPGTDDINGNGGNDTFVLGNTDGANGERIRGGVGDDEIRLIDYSSSYDLRDFVISEIERLWFAGNGTVTLAHAQFESITQLVLGEIDSEGEVLVFTTSGEFELEGKVTGADRIQAAAGNDEIGGTDLNEIILGGPGYDVLKGRVGTDKIYGGTDSDSLFGGEDADIVSGGGGDDKVSAGDEGDFASASTERDVLGGGAGDDTLYGDGGDLLIGGTDSDRLFARGAGTLISFDPTALFAADRGTPDKYETMHGTSDAQIFMARGFVNITGVDLSDELYVEDASTVVPGALALQSFFSRDKEVPNKWWLIQLGFNLAGEGFFEPGSIFPLSAVSFQFSDANAPENLFPIIRGGRRQLDTLIDNKLEISQLAFPEATEAASIANADMLEVVWVGRFDSSSFPGSISPTKINLVKEAEYLSLKKIVTDIGIKLAEDFVEDKVREAKVHATDAVFKIVVERFFTPSFVLAIIEQKFGNIQKELLRGFNFTPIPLINFVPAALDITNALKEYFDYKSKNPEADATPEYLAMLGDIAGAITGLFFGEVFGEAIGFLPQVGFAFAEALYVEIVKTISIKIDERAREIIDNLEGSDGADLIDRRSDESSFVYYTGDGNDKVLDGSGSSIFIVGSGGGDDTYDGGAGDDAAWYLSTTTGVQVNLGLEFGQGAEVGNDTLIAIEKVRGGRGQDQLIGSAGNNELSGESGDDSLDGGNGADTLNGDEGADRLDGGTGNDSLSGGIGTDTLTGGAGDDRFLIRDLQDLVIETSGGGADTIITSVSMTMPDHVETLQIADGISGIALTGGAGNDMLIGNGLTNTFVGGAGDDVILAGNVTLADIYALFTI